MQLTSFVDPPSFSAGACIIPIVTINEGCLRPRVTAQQHQQQRSQQQDPSWPCADAASQRPCTWKMWTHPCLQKGWPSGRPDAPTSHRLHCPADADQPCPPQVSLPLYAWPQIHIIILQLVATLTRLRGC